MVSQQLRSTGAASDIETLTVQSTGVALNIAQLLNERSVIASEPALDNAATAGGVAQLTGHSTAASLDIVNISTADRYSNAVAADITTAHRFRDWRLY